MDRVLAAKVFIDVTETRSFTKTAERLAMSRPMVTRYVDTIETWLQRRLLHRTTRQVSLTSDGEAYLAEITSWYQQAERLSSLAEQNDELSGSIRVATSMSFGYAQLMPALKEFMALHPQVEVDVDLADSTADLVERRIDLTLRIASNPDPSLIGKPIAKCESVLVASPQYLGQADKALILQPEDLKYHDCLGYKNFEQTIWHLSSNKVDDNLATLDASTFDKSMVSVETHCRLTCNETSALLHACLLGMGIAMQPTYLVNPYLQRGELCQVLPQWRPKDLTIYALYSSRKHLSPKVRALIDFLTQYFQQHSW